MDEYFVDTNWLVGVLAPVWFQDPIAVDMLEQHREGKLRIRLVKIAVLEARKVLSHRFKIQRLGETDSYFEWMSNHFPDFAAQHAAARNQVFNLFQEHASHWRLKLESLEGELAEFAVPFDEAAMDEEFAMWPANLGLEPFDSAILSSILAAARRSPELDAKSKRYFWSLDKDMRKPEIRRLCEAVGILVVSGEIPTEQ